MKKNIFWVLILFLYGCESIVVHHGVTRDIPQEQKVFVVGLSGILIKEIDGEFYKFLDTVFVSPGVHSYRVTVKRGKQGQWEQIYFRYEASANSTIVFCPGKGESNRSWQPFLLLSKKISMTYSLTLCDNFSVLFDSPWKQINLDESAFKK